MKLLEGQNHSVQIGSLLSLLLGLFHLYTSAFGVMEAYHHRGIHLSTMMLIVFLIKPLKGKPGRYSFFVILLNLLFLILTLVVGFYQTTNSYEILVRAGIPTTLDLIVGGVMIILVLEATRRTIGLPLVLIAAFFLFYTYFGPYMPLFIAHAGYSLKEIINVQFLGTNGLYGIPLGVMSTYIIIFVIFGSMLLETGASEFFNDLAKALVGNMVGGPAKVAVVTSGVIGSITGSVTANVVTTGSFTIPMMIKRGYSPIFAGAVEAAASTGGQIMPPIMGAAAFLIAEFLNIPYIQVATAALLPALLYFICIGVVVHLEAKKRCLSIVPKCELPRFFTVLREGWILFLPLVLLVYTLVRGYTPMRAGIMAIGALIVVSVAINIQKHGLRKGLEFVVTIFYKGTQKGVMNAVVVTSATATAGIIIGVIAQTGIGLRLTSLVISMAGNSLLLTLILIGLACLFLGMGMPTAGAYIMVAILGVPALIKLGVLPLAAHIFVFYLAMMSAVTPPVALGAYAAASITNESAWRTGLVAFRIAIPGFLIPFIIVYRPSIILQGNTLSIILTLFTSVIGLLGLSVGLEGFLVRKMSWLMRLLSIVGGLALIDQRIISNMLGIVAIFGVFLYQKFVPSFYLLHPSKSKN